MEGEGVEGGGRRRRSGRWSEWHAAGGHNHWQQQQQQWQCVIIHTLGAPWGGPLPPGALVCGRPSPTWPAGQLLANQIQQIQQNVFAPLMGCRRAARLAPVDFWLHLGVLWIFGCTSGFCGFVFVFRV